MPIPTHIDAIEKPSAISMPTRNSAADYSMSPTDGRNPRTTWVAMQRPWLLDRRSDCAAGETSTVYENPIQAIALGVMTRDGSDDRGLILTSSHPGGNR